MFDELMEFAEELEAKLEAVEKQERKNKQRQNDDALHKWLQSEQGKKQVKNSQKKQTDTTNKTQKGSENQPPISENDEILFW